MMELVVKINGGLGNQLFQYAAGRTLADQLGTELHLDLSFFDLPPGRHTARPFELDRFHTRYWRATPEQLNSYTALREYTWTRRTARLFPWLFSRQRFGEKQLFKFDPEVARIRKSTYLDGHWQSERYFADHAEAIRSDLRFRDAPSERNRELLRSMKGMVPVSLHVRRGDYVTSTDANATHGTCGIEYYVDAMQRVLSLAPESVFHVFSDDMDWARANLPRLAPMVFVDHNSGTDDHFDLLLMSACKHHIIANSSFSWWGAWLNPNPEKLVIAPVRWFRDPAIDTSDLIPAEWTRL